MMKYLPFLLLFLFSCQKKIVEDQSSIEGNNLYDQGIGLLLKDDVTAYSKFQQAINYFAKQKDSSNISKSLICQAIAQKSSGDILGAEATLVEALKMMKENDESFFSVYDTMANLKLDQKEYNDAINWYNKALSEKIPTEESRINILCNKSVAEFKTGKHYEALKILYSSNLSKINNQNLVNRIKDLIEYVKWLDNKTYPATEKIELILKDKLKNEDFWGANSCYSHLAEINQNLEPTKSLHYAQQMYDNAIKIKSPDDRLQAIERIILVDDPSHSKQNFKEYKILSDGIEASRNNYRKRFAFIKYDSEKKETENQRLKAKDAENKIEILQRNIGITTLLVLLTVGYFWYRRRKKRLQQEKELEVKNTELKYSKKVHDKVANKVYHVMSEVENIPVIDKNELLDKLESIYHISRDISYDDKDLVLEKDFSKQLSKMLKSYSSDTIKVPIIGNEEDIWSGVSDTAKSEIFYIMQELMTNMRKHSKADRVMIDFERENNLIIILYSDNGVGIQEHIPRNGLKNTESRINSINGTINFETQTEKGLKINLSFPVKK